MDEQERKDAIAPATVSIAGVMGLLNVLALRGIIKRGDVESVGEFMLDAAGRSEASPELQAHLHEALSHHLSTLLRELDQRGT